MSCEKYQKMISDWLDGNLKTGQEKKLILHLSQCDECQSYFEFQRYVKQELVKKTAADNSEEWWAEFEKRVKGSIVHISQEKEKKEKERFWKYAPALVGGLAVLFVLVVLVLRLPVKDETEQLVATTLSYEDTYLGLNQVIQKDENLAQKIDDELEKSITEEINNGSLERISPEEYNYYEQEINEYPTNNFHSENISLEE